MSAMTLIERLRVEANATEELHPGDSDIAVMREAADELERLERQRQAREGEETGWVIEHGRSQPSRPEYWAANGFDYDNLKAIRFARREDAERVANCLGGGFPEGYHRIADHMWCP